MCRRTPLDALYAEADQVAARIVARESDIENAAAELRDLRRQEARIDKDIRRAERRAGRIGLRHAMPQTIAHVR